MTLTIRPPFQHDRPLFVKIAATYKGRQYKWGDQLKWREQNLDVQSIMTLYIQDYLFHSDELEEKVEKVKIGDGLAEMDIDALHALVKTINEKVKVQVKNETEFTKKKCATSSIKDKQIGYIRRWRTIYGHFE